jgi:hypothetical protein
MTTFTASLAPVVVGVARKQGIAGRVADADIGGARREMPEGTEAEGYVTDTRLQRVQRICTHRRILAACRVGPKGGESEGAVCTPR